MTKEWARNLKLLGLLGVVVALLSFAYHLSAIFNPLLIALLLAYISDPIITRLEKVFRHRLLAIGFIVGYLLILFILIPVLLFGRLKTEAVSLVVALAGESSTDLNGNGAWDAGERFTDLNGDGRASPGELFLDTNGNGRFDRFEDGYFYAVLDRTKGWASGMDESTRTFMRDALDLDEVIAYVKSNLKQIATAGTRAGGWVVETLVSSFQGALDVLSILVLVPFYTFFLLYEWNDVKRRVSGLLPGRYRSRILDILGKIDLAVSAFFRGRLIICLVKGAVTAFGLWLCGIRFWFLIGFMAGFVSVIPVVGPVVGAIPSLTLAVIDYHGSLGRIVAVLLVFAFVEGLEGAVLTPVVLGKETGLHPVTLILSFLVFGKLFGLFGVLMAVPLMAIVKILVAEFVMPLVDELAQETPDEGDAAASAPEEAAETKEEAKRDEGQVSVAKATETRRKKRRR